MAANPRRFLKRKVLMRLITIAKNKFGSKFALRNCDKMRNFKN